MSEPVRVECPTCHTSYTTDRLGLPTPSFEDSPVIATIRCQVCAYSFVATITRTSWFGRFVRYDVTSHVR